MSRTVDKLNEKKTKTYTNIYKQILSFYEGSESIKEPVKELRGSIKVSKKEWVEEVIEGEDWLGV